MPKCPVCGQPLPKGVNEKQLHARLERVTARGRSEGRRAAEREFQKRLNERLAAQREEASRSAKREARGEIADAKRRADRAERDMKRAEKQAELDNKRKVEQARRDAEQQVRNAARQTERKYQSEIDDLEQKRVKDRTRFETENAQLRTQLDAISRKMEKQGADQLGKEAEVDLLVELKREFQGDRIDPVRRGVKGADIVHEIMEDGKRLGRIIYESKNHSTWKNDFVRQAKQHQTQYETPHVIVVSRTFPRKLKGLCMVKGITVVDPRVTVCLASIIRDGIKEIALAKMTAAGRNEKSRQLYDYICSDRFVTRFREIAESVESLREQQRKEKDRHEDVWHEQSTFYDKIDSRRREVDSQIRSIVKAAGNGRKSPTVRLAAGRVRHAVSSLSS